jgi:hypothetical protein
MSKGIKQFVEVTWLRFRGLSPFVQLILVFPVICAIALATIVGSMGLALMGTAIAINTFVAGWVGGLFILILGKAGMIVARDRKR